MLVPNGWQRVVALMKGDLPSVVQPGTVGRQSLGTHPPVTEDVVVTKINLGAGLTGGTPTGKGEMTISASGGNISLNEVLADNYMTAVDTTLLTASTCALLVLYRALTNVGGTKYSEGGLVSIHITGAGTALTQWNRTIGDNGGCLLDDSGISGNVVAGAIKLDITTLNLGATCQFNATVIAVEAP